MIPDLATLRDRATSKVRQIAYGVLSLGGAVRAATGTTTRSPTCCSLPSPRRSCSRALGCELRLRGLAASGWHATIFPPTSSRGDLRRLRDGPDAADPDSRLPRLGDLVTHGTSRTWRRSSSHRHDRRLRLCHGVLHRLVLGTTSSASPSSTGAGPYAWVLDDDLLQRGGTAGALVQAHAHHSVDALRGGDARQRRHVVRALRHHRHLALPRLPAVLVGLFKPTWVDLLTLAGASALLTLFLLFLRFGRSSRWRSEERHAEGGLEVGPHRGHGQYWARSRTSTSASSRGRAMSAPRRSHLRAEALRPARRVRSVEALLAAPSGCARPVSPVSTPTADPVHASTRQWDRTEQAAAVVLGARDRAGLGCCCSVDQRRRLPVPDQRQALLRLPPTSR